MSTGRFMREGLAHKSSAMSDADLFALVDSTGGWPLGFQYLGFEHTSERAAGFCNSSRNDGWWTVVASADDYYLWKLSPEALQRIADAAVSAVRLSSVDAQKLYIKNSRGWKAATSKAAQP